MTSTFSATAQAGPYTYFLLNKADSDGIRLYRWTTENDPVQSRHIRAFGTSPSDEHIQITTGASAITLLPPTSEKTLRLYYINKENLLSEIFLKHADTVTLEEAAQNWETGLLDQQSHKDRLVTNGAGLAAAFYQEDGHTGHRVYYQQDQPNEIHYAESQDGGGWKFGTVQGIGR